MTLLRKTRYMAAAWVVAAALSATPVAYAADKPAAAILPDSTALYIEVRDPAAIRSLLLDHPLVRQLLENPQVKAGLQANPGIAAANHVVAELERRLNRPFPETLKKLTSGGLYMAIDPATKGGVLMAQADEIATVQSLVEALLDLTREHAANEGVADPVEEGNHRGVTGYKVDKAVFGGMDRWMLIGNSTDLMMRLVDGYLDDDALSLSGDEPYRKALAGRNSQANGWAYLRLRMVRDLGLAPQLFASRAENAGAEFLFGGIYSTLRQAEYATAELAHTDSELSFSFLLPHDPSKVPASRAFFFPPAGRGAIKPLTPAGTIMSMSMYRDLAALWRAAPDLFEENVAAQFAKADSDLSNFFGGRSFANDVLTQLDPRFQLVAVRQTHDAADGPVPQVKIPAIATIWQTKDGQVIQPTLKVAFQTLLAFANLDAAQKGRPMLQMSTEKIGDAEMLYATYLVPAEDKGRTDAGMHYNFTPALVLSGNQFMLCSSHRLGRQLAELAAKQTSQELMPHNTFMQIHTPGVVEALRENREFLIADSMVKKGHDRQAAEGEIDFLLNAMQYLKHAKLELMADEKLMRLKMSYGLSK